jgi:hypothetical protein
VPTDWELVGRAIVVLGLAGVLGAVGRLAHGWLRRWYNRKGGGE